MKVYSEKTRIKSYHVDKYGNLDTVQVFKFMQEAAFRHSLLDSFGQPDLAKLGLVWMLSRMKVVFLSDAFLGDEIEIKSWVRSIKGALSERDFILTNGDKVVAKATSLWVCLSTDPVKPTAIPSQILAKMHIHDEFDKDFSTTKINSNQGEVDSHNYTIRPSDIDMVNHTNNVTYVRMMLDTINSDKKLKQLNVNYLLQSFEGDLLTISSQSAPSQTQVHEIVNAEGKVVCRLNTVWE